MRRIAGLLFAGGLAAGLRAGMTAIAHASDPVRPSCQGFGNAAEMLELG
jgi:hypothetical protein